MTPTVVREEADLRQLARELENVHRFAIDLESDGMYAYRAKLCVIQIATDAAIWIIDSLHTSAAPLAKALSADGPVKIIHDVAFDARLLAEAGISLGNVHDTALAAQWLGRPATGLGNLLLGDLQVVVDKSMQHHDWSRRPLDAKAITYLTSDVAHLSQLHDRLWGELNEKGIEAEVLIETDYRISTAIEGANTSPPPAYLRMKGIEKAASSSRPALRRLAAIRERLAEAANVPPYKIAGNEILFAIAAAQPETEAKLLSIRGADRLRRAARDILTALRESKGESLPPEEEEQFRRPRISHEEIQAKKQRETSLNAWRKAEATKRGVDEQAVLPGHCLREFASRDGWTFESLASVGGFGDVRIARYGKEILNALAAPPVAPPAKGEEISK